MTFTCMNTTDVDFEATFISKLFLTFQTFMMSFTSMHSTDVHFEATFIRKLFPAF